MKTILQLMNANYHADESQTWNLETIHKQYAEHPVGSLLSEKELAEEIANDISREVYEEIKYAIAGIQEKIALIAQGDQHE
jgi:hypothetical protein